MTLLGVSVSVDPAEGAVSVGELAGDLGDVGSVSPVEPDGVSGGTVFFSVSGWSTVSLLLVSSPVFVPSTGAAATTSSFGCSMTACLISTTVELEMGDITTLGCCSVIWL